MSRQTFYVLKVKGKAKIPDYIQVRDEHFTLIGYFRPGRAFKGKAPKGENEALMTAIEQQSDEIPFGKVTKIEV